MGEAIVVTSGKGGVGKTTTSANVGTALALMDKSVCLVDTDIGLRNLDVVMGLENRIVFDIVDVAENRVRLSQALVKDKRFAELYMLPAAQTRDKLSISPQQVKQIADDLKAEFDYVIIDCPAGIEQGFRNAIGGADRAIVVTTPEKSAVRDADRIIGLLEQENIPARLVINRIREKMLKNGDMLSIEDIMQVLAIDLLGIIPDDEYVLKAANTGELAVMNPSSQACIAYRNIARRILGDSVPLMDLTQKASKFPRLRKLFGMGVNS
jgi:septum site-determining protein MinD